jgi:polyvinyl alcohol dehydrogenase (cytochrome)
VQGGGLTALKISDGTKVWLAASTLVILRGGCSPAQPAAVTAIGAVFSGSMDGHLRRSPPPTATLWISTRGEASTVNAFASGGSSMALVRSSRRRF